MIPKVYHTLELDKVLDKLTTYAAFSASATLLRELAPTGDLAEAQQRQRETTEARNLLEERANVTIGGARDIRPHARDALRGIVLSPAQLLEVKVTLQAAGALRRTITQVAERFPLLARLAANLSEGKHLVEAINQVIDDQGEILDSASPTLMRIRTDLRITHDRLHSKLQSLVNSSAVAPYLQEALITLRSGRYVIPIKAEAKGRVKGIVHDQSASGATLFVEPLATVEINNQIRELELAEEEEIRRLLTELSGQVGIEASAIIATVEALAALDAAFARAKYATTLRASEPILVGFDSRQAPGITIKLYGARHPLLDPLTVVPIDVELDEDTYIVVVTGPNTGGKTVSLKTIGLLALMAQCGLHIPAAEGSTLTVFESVYADIGDEQSIEQSLSTFSSHLHNIIGILGKANERSLVLLDELGAGTDPAEGSAIARALLSEFLQRGVTTFATTHYPELKLYAHNTPGVRNASVEFDVDTLSPTYHLIMGLPGRSNALAIAERLGLPRPIIEAARSYVKEIDLQTDDLLDEIHRTREEIRQTQARLLKAESDARQLQSELQLRLDGIEEERRAIIEAARVEAESELEALRKEIRQLRRRLSALAPMARQAAGSDPALELKEIERSAAMLAEHLEAPITKVVKPVPAATSAEGASPKRGLRPGDHVYVAGLNAEGEIVALHAGHDVEVQVGLMRVRVDADQLEWRPASGRGERGEEPPYSTSVKTPRPPSPGMELHLRGFLVEDALPMLDEYLDQAYLAGLPWVSVVHGRGTGALRKAVREHLRSHPLVKEYKRAAENEGGDGVTIVTFVPLS